MLLPILTLVLLGVIRYSLTWCWEYTERRCRFPSLWKEFTKRPFHILGILIIFGYLGTRFYDAYKLDNREYGVALGWRKKHCFLPGLDARTLTQCDMYKERIDEWFYFRVARSTTNGIGNDLLMVYDRTNFYVEIIFIIGILYSIVKCIARCSQTAVMYDQQYRDDKHIMYSRGLMQQMMLEEQRQRTCALPSTSHIQVEEVMGNIAY